MARRPTLEDVAALAGVSIATADRVVNRRGVVGPTGKPGFSLRRGG